MVQLEVFGLMDIGIKNRWKKFSGKSLVDWHYDEIYGMIHELQPQALIGNNHHLE